MSDPAPVTPTPPAPPQSRTTIAPPRPPQMTAAQMLADNLATRIREIAAMASLVLLAKWGLLPGQWAGIIIAAIVLPIELTRQIGKGVSARAAALTGGGALGAVVIVHKALTWGSIGVAAVAALASCSGTQVQQEMRAADTLGLAANHAEPVWMRAFRIDGEGAADAVCTDVSDAACVQHRLDAVHAVAARWSRVRDQWEIARRAHDAYAGCLEAANRADGGVCPDPDAARLAIETAILSFRCELRAVGHPEADPLGPGVQCPSDSSSAAPGGAQ